MAITYLVGAKPGLYDRGVASTMATVSTWSYADVTSFAEVMSRRGFAGGEAVSINLQNDALLVGTTAYLLQDANQQVVILSFRGTEPGSGINWLGNVSAKPEPFHVLGNVHGGFYRPLLAMWNVILDLLDKAMDGKSSLCIAAKRLMEQYVCKEGSDSPGVVGGPPTEDSRKPLLYITGHSLGGALAVLAAARIFTEHRLYEAYWKDRLRGIYTFGQPMVGDKEFATRFEDVFKGTLFRHVYENDVFPRLPPRTVGNFWHIGEEYVSTKSGWAYQSQGLTQAHTFVGSTLLGIIAFVTDQLAGMRIAEWIPWPYSVEAHSPLNYLRVSQMAHPATALL